MIDFGIGDRIPDGFSVQFHTDDLLCVVAGDHADGADSAVGIDDRLFSGKAGVFDGFSIDHFRLFRIHLIEGFRGNAETFAA